MGVNLILMRRSAGGQASSIAVEEWRAFVGRHADLRFRTPPWVATNPRTGAIIQIAAAPEETEVSIEGEWLPFMHLRRGELCAQYQPYFDDEDDPVRLKIIAVAKELGAVIGSDAGDDLLDW